MYIISELCWNVLEELHKHLKTSLSSLEPPDQQGNQRMESDDKIAQLTVGIGSQFEEVEITVYMSAAAL